MNYRTILLAVDLEPESAAVIDYAFGLGEKLGAVVHTLHAFPGGVISNADGSAPITGDAAKEYAKRELRRALAPHSASSSMGKCLVNTSEPITAVLHTATEVSADLIIISTHARQGAARVIQGSVAEGVLHEAKVPVLVMKPGSKATTPGASPAA